MQQFLGHRANASHLAFTFSESCAPRRQTFSRSQRKKRSATGGIPARMTFLPRRMAFVRKQDLSRRSYTHSNPWDLFSRRDLTKTSSVNIGPRHRARVPVMQYACTCIFGEAVQGSRAVFEMKSEAGCRPPRWRWRSEFLKSLVDSSVPSAFDRASPRAVILKKLPSALIVQRPA